MSDALEITEDANGKVKVITKPELQIDTIEQMLDSNKKKQYNKDIRNGIYN